VKLIVVITCVLVLAVTAQAGAGSAELCTHGGWVIAQSGSGEAFASLKECVQAKEVFRPSLTITPDAVDALEVFVVSGEGFHKNQQDEPAVLSFAITGSEPWLRLGVGLKADGTFSHPAQFSGCGSVSDLTLTLTDSSGVHASARLTLCGGD